MSTERRHKIERQTPVIVPAHPGWFGMHPVWHSGVDRYTEFSPQPVIAWSVELVRDIHGEWITHADPVMVENLHLADEILRRPDGLICVLHDQDFDDEKAALDYLTERDREETPAPVAAS